MQKRLKTNKRGNVHEFISTDKKPVRSVCRTEMFWHIFMVNEYLCMDGFHIHVCLFLTVAFPDNIHVCVLNLFKITIKTAILVSLYHEDIT